MAIALTDNANKIQRYVADTRDTDRIATCTRAFGDRACCERFALSIISRALAEPIRRCDDIEQALAAAKAKNYGYVIDACAPR